MIKAKVLTINLMRTILIMMMMTMTIIIMQMMMMTMIIAGSYQAGSQR